MAEYAGLEIRIGGDTTRLNNALKAPTKSAAELQARIRQITRAMQFDPTNLQNVETRIKLTGDRMQSLQVRAKLAKTAMKQLGDSIVWLDGKDRSVADIATTTDNLSLAAKQADERYVKLTGSLATVYETWNKLARSTGKDFAHGVLNISAEDADRLMDVNTTIGEVKQEIADINSMRRANIGGDAAPIISDKDLKNLIEFKKLNFHAMFENGFGLDEVVGKARELGIAISDDAVYSVKNLQQAFRKAADDKKAFDKALQYEQLGNDIQRIESEAEDLSQTMRKLDDRMSKTKGYDLFQRIEGDIRKVDAALDNVESDLERTEAAMKVDPKNIELAARYMNDLQQKVSLSEEKASLLNREMQLLKSGGAKEAAKGHQDLAKWIEESAEKAREAKKALSDQGAEVKNLEDSVKQAEQTLALLKRDKSLVEFSDNVIKWQKNTARLSNELETLESRTKAATDAQNAYNDANAKFEKAKADADELSKAIKKMQRQYDKLDKAAEEAMDNGTFTADMLDDINKLEAEIETAKTAYASLKEDVKQYRSELKNATQINERKQTDLDEQREKVEKLRQSVEKLSRTKDVRIFENPGDDIEKEEQAIEELKGELEQAKAKEKERQAAYSSAEAENNLAKEAKAFNEVQQEADETRAKILETKDLMSGASGPILNPSTLKSWGMTLSATVTPIMFSIGRSMVDASSDIDSAYRNMRKTVEGSEEDFEALRRHAIEFSTTHVTSADQILEIEAIGGELGIATENLTAFAEAISNLEVSSNLDIEGAADALGHLANIMHIAPEDYDGFSDALVRLGNNGASTETEIANIAERIGSMGSIVGMSASDVLALASSIASTGQNAEAAGTAISKTLSFFETAVAAAGGTIDTSFESINAAVQSGGDELTVFANLAGKSAEEFVDAWEADPKAAFKELSEYVDGAKGSLQGIADVAHMSADDFAKAWESDPTSVMKAFIEGLNDIEGAGGSADSVLQNLGITSVRQKQAIEGLMQTVGGLDDNLQMSSDAWNGITDKWGKAGDAANEAAKKAEGFSGQLEIMKNMGKNALSELGEGAVPWIQKLTGAFESLSKWFSGLSDGTKEAIVGFGGLAAAAGPALTLVSTFLTSKTNVAKWAAENVSGFALVAETYKKAGNEGVKALTGMSYGMASTKMIAKSFGTAILKAFSFGVAIAAIVALVSALKNLYDRYQDHITATKGLKDALRGIGDEADVSVDSFNLLGSHVRDLAKDSKDYEGRLADLTHTIEESNGKYSTFSGTLTHYGDAVRELAGKEGRTKEESAKLAAALQGINDACGTTYGIDEYGNIIDTQTGKIQDNTDAILDNIDAKRNQALLEYYSDDYAQAVGQFEDAKANYEDARNAFYDLRSESGKERYFEHAKEVYGSNYNEAQIQAAYNKELDDAETAMHNYGREVEATGEVLGTLEGKMDVAQKALEENQRALDAAAEAEEAYNKRTETVMSDVTGNMKKLSDAVTGVGGDDAGFNSIADGLEAISVGAKELNDVDMTALAVAFDSANGSMQEVIQTLENGGVKMEAWNAALEQAPGAAEHMAGLTAAAFQSMYDIAGQDLNNTMLLIAGLDEIQVGEKTFYVGDNGSIVDSEGRIYDIRTQLEDLPDEVITLINADNSDAQEKISETESSRKKLDGASATVGLYANDYASGKISSVKEELQRLHGRSATTDVYVRKHEAQATGGMNNRPVIPRHATGYIATGPTLTNQGWIGEDGIEAVANWATGGAVVPLTNKRYMLPIADAIAEGMTQRLGGSLASGATYNTYINDAVVNGDAEVQAAVLALLSTLQRKGAMNRG